MTSQHYVPRALSVLAVVAVCLYGTGCPINEPIAGDAGTSGVGGTSGDGGTSGTTATGGVSGFVGDTGGGPSIGVEDGTSGISGRE